MKVNWWKAALPLIVWLVIVLIPPPDGLKLNAWYYFALFAAVVVGLVLEPIPNAALGLIGVTIAVVMGYVFAKPGDSLRWGLSGFSNSTVWLIFGAFMLSLGYEKTGLGRRIALLLVRALGGKTLGLGYAITLADLAIAPGTPSNTARSAGTIYPIICNIPALFGSEPGPTSRKIGAYLMWTAFTATAITSSMFITSMAANPLAISLIKQATKLDITWGMWFVGFLPIAIVLLIIGPLLVYIIYPPEIKTSKEVPIWARGELNKLGALTLKEIVMAALVVLAIALWIFGGSLADATTVVMIIISIMVITKILDWNDILGHKQAWNIFIWFATLVTLADGLGKVGFVTWAAKGIAGLMSGMSPMVIMTILVVFFFVVHYLFASLTAHTTAVLPVLLGVAMAIPGIPLLPFSLLLAYSLGLMGIISPYATGPAPIYYGCGYISRTDFWKLGLIFGAIFLIVLLVIGIPYLTSVHI